MKRSHLINLIILPTVISAAAPPASCTSDEQCSVTQRSKVPSQSSTDVGLCGCYATSSIDPFDECEGNNTSCAHAKCIADACVGLTSSCSNNEICVLELDETATSTTQATSSTNAVVDCSVLSTCSECLENEACAHWTVDECHASCVGADASCYTNSGGFTGMTIDEICTKADDDSKDSALCGSMTDCISCVEAVKSDDKACMWFEEGYCDTGCNMSGCGSTDATICSGGSTTSTQATSSTNAVVDCSVLSTCSECLENEACAHWTVGECHASCVVADTSCYTNSGGFTGMSIDEICTKADDDSKDSALCGSITDCISCVEAVKSDDKACMWFEEGYCDTGCNMSGCGSTDATICSGGSTTSTQATVAGGSVGATPTQATVPQSTIPADFTTTTSSTSSTALVRNDPVVSSGNTYRLFFVCVSSSTFIASFLFLRDLY